MVVRSCITEILGNTVFGLVYSLTYLQQSFLQPGANSETAGAIITRHEATDQAHYHCSAFTTFRRILVAQDFLLPIPLR